MVVHSLREWPRLPERVGYTAFISPPVLDHSDTFFLAQTFEKRLESLRHALRMGHER